MTKRKLSFSFFLFLVSLWWGWATLIDMVVIPTVFRTIPDFFLAGNLGIAVFSKLNKLELIVSTMVVCFAALQLKKQKSALPLFIIALVSWSVVMFYFTYLTDKITELTDLWKKAESMGLIGTDKIPDLQQEHQFFHHLYIKLDVLKLILLSSLLGYGIYSEDKWV